MLFVESNQIKAQTPNGIFQIKSGQAIFHAPGEIHHHFNDYDQNAMIIDIVFNSSSQYLYKLQNTIVQLSYQEIIKLNELLDIAIIPEECKYFDEDSVKKQYIKNNLELLLLDIIRTHMQPRNNDTTAEYYNIIINVLHSNVYKPLRLQDIAKECRLSESTVKQVFHSYHGVGIMTYFNQLKISEIKKHIAQGIPISVISQSMSFSSQNYFSSFFKRETGLSPREYKNKLKKTCK
ncbi:MAG: AraC family transcriptional regulator [Clostridia bacterium]|nr:AraC family transcriptional regulator [Clostridia bacterium]